ncbi:hypothetical protein [Tahibacter amnicola]|uniref:Uncharacterized protein n=1 Tax=Tahibacter amnicola TaxID=2976241 RepID=A0ABY6BBB8_9GAMM|nr:hypothetical protein [Tahibacter amnicola]UXI66832.1 hypothetical protein N4264_19040 [Tahibacter amnicola]
MTERFRTPQEKKLLSYVRDGRNVVAESRTTARKAIARRKATANQALRKSVHEKLSAGLRAAGDVQEFDPTVPRTDGRSWRKFPDASLARYVQERIDYRQAGGQPATVGNSDVRAKAMRKRQGQYR